MVSARVTTHWMNGWFLRLFSRAYLVIGTEEIQVEWGKWVTAELPNGPVQVGAGVRYTSRSELGGFEPRTIQQQDGTSCGSIRELTLRNGFWNHSPFEVENRRS